MAAAAAAMLATAALILTGFGAASASAVTPVAASTTLEVHLTSAAGAPVSDAQLAFFPAQDGDLTFFGLLLGTRGVAVAKPVHGKPGTYTVDLSSSAFGPGDYTAYLSSSSQLGTASQYLGGFQDAADADTVAIHPGANTVNLSFAKSGSITGTVTTSSGRYPSGVCVDVYQWNGVKWISGASLLGLSECSVLVSSKTGKYSINPGSAGSYKVKFVSETGAYVDQFSNGATDIDDAPAVYLGSGQSAVVSTTLTASGSFSGTLISSSARAVSGAEVVPYLLTGNPTDGFTDSTEVAAGFDITDTHGAFTLRGLHTGYYAIGYVRIDASSPTLSYIGGPDAEHARVFSAASGKALKLGALVATPATSTPVATGDLDVTLTGSALPADVTGMVGFVSPSTAGGIIPDYNPATHVLHFADLPQGTARLLAIDTAGYVPGHDAHGAPTPAPGARFLPVEQDLTIAAGTNTATIAFEPVTALVFSTAPTLDSTTPQIGTPLTASAGETNHSTLDSATSYQWFRTVDGASTPIFAARGASYTPRGVDAGSELSVKVTNTFQVGFIGLSLGAQTVSQTITTDTVPTAGQLHATGAPSIVAAGGIGGGVGVGTTARVAPGTWDVPGVHLSYQWHRVQDAGDSIIADATRAAYTLAPADFGHEVYATVVATKDGYDASAPQDTNRLTVTSGAAPTIAKAPTITAVTTPTGRTFTITPGTWSLPATGLHLTYSWTADDASGTPVTGTGSSFSTAARGAVSVTATAASDAYLPGTWSGTAQRGVVASPFTAISDSTTPGSFAYTLGVSGSAIAYQQHSAGEKVTGTFQRLVGRKWTAFTLKTGVTYVTTVKDIGAKLRYVSTFTSPLYATVTSTTAAFAVTARTGLTDNGVVTVGGPVTIGGTLSADLADFPVSSTKHTFQWQSSSDGLAWKNISRATGQTLVTTSPLLAGQQVRVIVASTASGFAPDSTTSAAVTLVAGLTPIINTAAPTVTPGDLRAGRTAKAGTGAWSVAGVTFSYDWRIDGTSTELTGSTYSTSAADAGHELTVAVTAHRVGYTDSAAVESAPITLRDPEAKAAHLSPISLTGVKVGSAVSAGDPKVIFGLDDSASDFSTSYQWKLDGRSVAGATASSFVPTTLGKKLSVTVTLNSDVYGRVVATSASTAIALGNPRPLGVTVGQSDPTAVSGTVLTARVDNPWGLALKYQWQSSTDADTWTSVSGATTSTFTIGGTMTRRFLRVVGTGTKTGYQPTVVPTATVLVSSRGQLTATVDPTIGGAQVDRAQAADPGSWNIAGATYSYQWMLDGVAIPGATSATFSPAPKLAGRELSLRVTASKPGYTSGSAVSDSQRIAIGAAAIATVQPKVTASTSTCGLFTVSSGTWSTAAITETYQWTQNGAAVPNATGTSFTPSGDGGVAVVITVTSTGHAGTTVTLGATAGPCI